MNIEPNTIILYALAAAVAIFVIGLAASLVIRLIRSALRDTEAKSAAEGETTKAASK